MSKLADCWDRGIRQLRELTAAKIRSREGLIQQLLNGRLRFQEYSGEIHEQVPLSQVLEKVADSVIPSASAMYREIGVRSHGKGIFHKDPVSGESLGNKRVYRVVPGCLTFNIVFAWERAVAITTDREDGMIASHRFPMFRPKPGRLLAEYALLYVLSKKGAEALELASPGGAGRNRTLSQTGFLKNLIPLPSIDEQRRIVTFVQTADREIELLWKQLDAFRQQKKGLMQKLLSGEVRVLGKKKGGT
jgi:restriction endonuclease S subunit